MVMNSITGASLTIFGETILSIMSHLFFRRCYERLCFRREWNCLKRSESLSQLARAFCFWQRRSNNFEF
jgi:hypothetical protein